MTTDEELVRRIQRGDEAAWAAFLERYTDLIYSKASQYGRLSSVRTGAGDWCDERDELYLFMAQALRRSLQSFQMSCRPRTWVFAVVGNRRQVVKAYLMQKAPARADVRLPKAMASRPALDKQIFRRLVWGIEPLHIAWDLNTDEQRCAEVEDLLRRHSPRVYERVQSNRIALKPTLNMDDQDAADSGDQRGGLAAAGRNPEQLFESKATRQVVQQALTGALTALTVTERRVLILLYSHDMSAADIVALAASDEALLAAKIGDINRCYYIKDRALGKIADSMSRELARALGEEVPDAEPRQVYRRIEALLRECGIPAPRLSE